MCRIPSGTPREPSAKTKRQVIFFSFINASASSASASGLTVNGSLVITSLARFSNRPVMWRRKSPSVIIPTSRPSSE